MLEGEMSGFCFFLLLLLAGLGIIWLLFEGEDDPPDNAQHRADQ